jgi:hypothetical protein
LFAHFETKNDRPTPKATTPKETLRRVDAPQGVPPSAVHDSTAAPPKKKRKPILRRGEGGALVNEHGGLSRSGRTQNKLAPLQLQVQAQALAQEYSTCPPPQIPTQTRLEKRSSL